MKVTRRRFVPAEEVGFAGFYVDAPAKDTAEVELAGKTFMLSLSEDGRFEVLGPHGFIRDASMLVRLYKAVPDWRF